MNKKILLINSSSNSSLNIYVDHIANLVSTTLLKTDIIHYSNTEEVNPFSYSGIIISPTYAGSSNDDLDTETEEWNNKLVKTKFIENCQCPVFGMCGGHILLGKIFGADLIYNKEKEFGDDLTVTITDPNDPILNGITGEIILVKQDHNNSITLPTNFKLLSSSKKCKVQLMKHQNKLIYGSQFHAEENNHIFFNYIAMVKKYINEGQAFIS